MMGEDHYFDMYFVWGQVVLQSGQVQIVLKVRDNAGMETSVSSLVTVTEDDLILQLQQQKHSISRQRGAEMAKLYGDLSEFLFGLPQLAFDSEYSSIMAKMIYNTSAVGVKQSNSWRPHIQNAINAVSALNPPDAVAQSIKTNTLTFLNDFYDYAETTNNNYLTYIPIPSMDIPPLQEIIQAYSGLAIISDLTPDVGHFAVSSSGRSLFDVTIDKSVSPPIISGTVYGVPLNDDQKLHPVLATMPVVDDIYMNDSFDLLKNTFDNGGWVIG